MSQIRIRSTRSAKRIACWVVLLSGAVLSAGCGMYMAGTNPSPAAAQQTKTQVKIGDAPAARVIAFEVVVGPIVLTNDSGSSVTVLSGSQHIELSHLSGTNEPLSLLSIPQGSYKSATLTVSNPEVTFIDTLGRLQHIEPTLAQTITIPLSPSLVISGSSAVVSIDVDVSNALTFDAQGNVTGVGLSASSFHVSSAVVTSQQNQGDEDGELEDTSGVISSVNGTSFNLTVAETGAVLTFATDGNTEFEDGASLSVNAMVIVEGSTRPDGSLFARKVEGVENENGSDAGGVITGVSGSPATALTFVADEGMGTGMDDTKVGQSVTADVSNATFQVKQGDVDTSGIGGLPSSEFPFDASTVHAGQRIEVESKDGMTGTSMVAEKVRLQQQALVGTVSGLNGTTTSGPTTFTLTVPSDSAFAMLSGSTQLVVFWQPGTELHNLNSVNSGDTIKVRGLVFFTGSTFNMIARRISN